MIQGERPVQRSNWLIKGIASSLIAVVAGCATAPPQYDDQTDKLISQLQKDVDTQIVSLITLDHKIAFLSGKTDASSQKALAEAKTKAGYEANTGFYDKVDVDITGLQTRVDAEPSLATPYLDKGIQALRDNLLVADGSMQTTHQQVDILSEPYLRTAEKIIDAQIEALLTRELGLKNGAATGKSSDSAAPSESKSTRPAGSK
jgi:hypothetical protein